MRQSLGLISGFFAIACGAFFSMALHDWIVGDGKTSPGVLLGMTVFFGALTAMCAGASYKALFMPAPSKQRGADDVEHRVLALAATNEGRITVAELALHAAITLEQAELALDGLAARGRADVEVTASGETVYRVRGLMSAGEKSTARDPIA